MKFEKGNNHGKGRSAGSKNTKTQMWDELGETLVTTGATKFLEELNKLEGEAYLNMYVKVLSYFKPKYQSIDSNIAEEKQRVINTNRPSEPININFTKRHT